MTSSTIPSARRPSAGASFDSRRSRGWPSWSDRSASRTTTGWAHEPPTQPSIVPSGWTIPREPGFAEVGRWTATTVAVAKTAPAASSSAWRAARLRDVMASDHALVAQDLPHLRRRDRDVDVADPQVPQRVDDRVRDRRGRADRRRLADALGADRVVRRRG